MKQMDIDAAFEVLAEIGDLVKALSKALDRANSLLSTEDWSTLEKAAPWMQEIGPQAEAPFYKLSEKFRFQD
jgi:hypothetical protein